MFNHPWTSADVRGQECLPDPSRLSTPRRVSPRRRRRAAASRPGPYFTGSRSQAGKRLLPSSALLQDVAATGCSADGTTFAVLELLDASQCSHLALVTGKTFGDIDFLQLLLGTELCLDASSGVPAVVPLAQQSKAVRQHLLAQLISRHRKAASMGDDDSIAAERLASFMNQVMGGD